jgi:hypothetical protein
MHKASLAAFVLLIASYTFAQNVVHPYVAGGAILNGSGMVPYGGDIEAGVQIDAPHLFSYTEAGYETGGKENDNDNTSTAGHTRLLENETLARIGNYYVGAGIDWSKLYTPDYTKSHVHPRLTVGREFYNGYISKVLVSYVHPGTDWQNGVQGAEVQGWWTGKHVFLRMTLGAYRYYTTVTDPTNKVLTAEQKSQHGLTSQFQTLLGVRF